MRRRTGTSPSVGFTFNRSISATASARDFTASRSFLERRGRGLPEGRLGAAYVVAAALSIILLSKNRYAEVGWLDLLKGEIITVDNADLVLTAGTLALVLAVLGLFHKELLLVSFDRSMAITLGKSVVFWTCCCIF